MAMSIFRMFIGDSLFTQRMRIYTKCVVYVSNVQNKSVLNRQDVQITYKNGTLLLNDI